MRCWRISKRLVTLHYTASARLRGTADEVILTTLPPGTVPLDNELRPIPPEWPSSVVMGLSDEISRPQPTDVHGRSFQGAHRCL